MRLEIVASIFVGTENSQTEGSQTSGDTRRHTALYLLEFADWLHLAAAQTDQSLSPNCGHLICLIEVEDRWA